MKLKFFKICININTVKIWRQIMAFLLSVYFQKTGFKNKIIRKKCAARTAHDWTPCIYAYISALHTDTAKFAYKRPTRFLRKKIIIILVNVYTTRGINVAVTGHGRQPKSRVWCKTAIQRSAYDISPGYLHKENTRVR